MNSIVFVSENNHDIKVCVKTPNGWLLLETVVGISEDLRATLPKPQRDLFLTTEEAWQYAEERANYYRQRIPMTEYDISMLYLDDVKGELLRAINKFPTWPDDPLHALAILVEEVGELSKTILENRYEGKEPDIKEAIQTAAMALRFLANWVNYRFEEPQP